MLHTGDEAKQSMKLRMGLSGNGQLSDSTHRFAFGFDLMLFCYFKAC